MMFSYSEPLYVLSYIVLIMYIYVSANCSVKNGDFCRDYNYFTPEKDAFYVRQS